MRLAIMQPYFFPYIGYYALINYVDRFILFDVPQFIRHGWIERNRVLKPNEGWMYVKVPLEKHSRDTAIKDVQIRTHEHWQEKILQQLIHYKKKAPYYQEVRELLNQCFDYDTPSIVDLNRHILENTCEYIGINTPIEVLTAMNLQYESAKAADEWALNISLAMGANEYVNPPGGEDFFDRKKYHDKKIKLTFLETSIEPYDQKRSIFEPGLSIIDVLMFNDPEVVNKMINTSNT